MLSPKEKRTLVSSVSWGLQFMSNSVVLAGSAEGTTLVMSATTDITPSVEHTAKIRKMFGQRIVHHFTHHFIPRPVLDQAHRNQLLDRQTKYTRVLSNASVTDLG